MLKIAICDDEEVFASFLAKKTMMILDDMNIKYAINTFVGPEELLQVILNNQDDYQIYFLDILMDDIDGMTLAKEIRKKKSEAVIIFVTSTSDYALKGYDVQAFRYIMKPICHGKLKDALEEVYEKFFKATKIFVKCKTQFVQLNVDEIYYLEISGRKVAIHMSEGTMVVSSKLSELENRLPINKFCRTHQSFIVNLDYVAELRYGELTMISNKNIPISRTFQKNIQKIFLERLSKL